MALEIESIERRSDKGYEEVEVLADSLNEALKLASNTTHCDIGDLEYEIVQRGKSSFFGMLRSPYRVIVKKYQSPDSDYNLEDLEISLNTGKLYNEFGEEIEPDVDGKAIVRIYSHGVFLKIIPPKGNGEAAGIDQALESARRCGVMSYDKNLMERALKKKAKDPVKIGNYIPKPEADSGMTIDVSDDEMEVSIMISSPRPGGRHLTAQEVVQALKKSGIQFGFQEDKIQEALDSDLYGEPIVAVLGNPVKNGKDGYVDYKVRIDKKIEFKEDESGRIDFLAKDLIENVVQGQVLAELLPPEKGEAGRTIYNKVLPATDGIPSEMRPGKGTILSEDGKQLIAEKNGQVVYVGGKVNVEENYIINGDVGLDTGNIMFLGSVTVRGSVSDNMEVKAAGNIEVAGSVQKAHMEAEGDVIVRQGIQGRDGAVIESTTGSAFAKFIQNTEVNVERDVIVSEGVLHSKIHAGGKIICNGKRAQIVGGEIMAGEEVRVKQLGAQASTPTYVVVGTNPKILQQIKQLEAIANQAKEKLDKIEQNLRTLTVQKNTQGEEFTATKEDLLLKMTSAKEKLVDRIKEADGEKTQLSEYMAMLATGGKVHVEKTLYPGVRIEINGAEFLVNDEYHNVTFTEENGNIKILPYESEDGGKKKRRSSAA